MKILKRICIFILCIVLFSAAVLFTSFYKKNLDFYQNLQELDDVGYFDGETLTLNNKTYSSEFVPDLDNYSFKSEKPEKVYHIIASPFKPVAVLQDFAVESYQDDPNGYILKGQKDAWGYEVGTYYSSDFKLPDPKCNQIRQIFVTFSPIEFPSSGYTSSISDAMAVKKIIACLQDEKNPVALIQDAGVEMLSDSYRIWVDYSDFPMYQLIYNENTSK